MELLDELPIIYTKDADWMNTLPGHFEVKPGRIFLLPEDAIVVRAPKQEAAK